MWVARWDSPNHTSDSVGKIGLDQWGNVYVGGSTDGGRRQVLLRYNANGELLWHRIIDLGPQVRALAVDADGCCYLASEDQGSAMMTLKYSSEGELLWQRTYGRWSALLPYDIAIGTDGCVYVTSAYTLKYSPDGDLLWAQEHPLGSASHRIAVDAAGNAYVVGPLCLLKYSSEGVLLWERKSNNPGKLRNAKWLDVALDSSGNCYVVGDRLRDYFTAKYSPEGQLIWAQRYDSGYGETALGLALGPDNEVVVTGSSWNGYDYDFLTLKYSQYGPTQPLKK